MKNFGKLFDGLICIWSVINWVFFLGFSVDLVFLGNAALVSSSGYGVAFNAIGWLVAPLLPIFLISKRSAMDYEKMQMVECSGPFSQIVTCVISLAACYTISFVYFVEFHNKVSFL